MSSKVWNTDALWNEGTLSNIVVGSNTLTLASTSAFDTWDMTYLPSDATAGHGSSPNDYYWYLYKTGAATAAVAGNILTITKVSSTYVDFDNYQGAEHTIPAPSGDAVGNTVYFSYKGTYFQEDSDYCYQCFKLGSGDSTATVTLQITKSVLIVRSVNTSKARITLNSNNITHTIWFSLLNKYMKLWIDGVYQDTYEMTPSSGTFQGKIFVGHDRNDSDRNTTFQYTYIKYANIGGFDYNAANVYAASGTNTLVYDATTKVYWTSYNFGTGLLAPANTVAKIRCATSDDNSTWSSWSSYFTLSGGQLTGVAPSRYIKAEVNLSTSLGSVTPTVGNLTLYYNVPGSLRFT